MSRKPKSRDVLTKRQREILTIMRDKDEELVYEHGRGYIEYSPISPRTVFALLRLCAIQQDCVESMSAYYYITGTGLKLLNNDTSDLKLLAEEMRPVLEAATRRGAK
jgi:hypothetical protein